MRTMKLMLSLMLILALLTACGGSTPDTARETTSSSTTSKQSDGSQETTVPIDPPITFTALTTYDIGTAVWGEDPISRKITELTNVTLDLEYATGDMNERLGIMLAAGDYPDMVMSVDNYMITDMLDAEALLPLDEYIEKHGTNIKKVFGDMLGAMKSPDGHFYGFNKEFGAIPITRDWYMQVQYPLLKEFGYPKIQTLDELGDLVEQYVNKYKTYKDIPLIGVLSAANQQWIHQGIGNAAMRASGFQDDGYFYINPDSLQSTYVSRMQETKLYFKWLNKMNNKGLFSLDSFSMDHAKVGAEAAKGNVLVVTSPEWAFKETEKSIRTINATPEMCYAKIPIYVSEEARARSNVSNYDSLGTWKSVITKNCKDPERAFKFFDTMWSEEMNILCWWGVEGDLYTLDEGKRILKPEAIDSQKNDSEFRAQTGVGLYDYWTRGTLLKDSTDQYINPYQTPEMEAMGYTDADKEVIAAYDPKATIWADLWPAPKQSEWGFAWKISLPKGDGAVAQARVQEELVVKYSYQLVTAKDEAEFDAVWDEFQMKMVDAGIETREKELNEALAKRMDTWYSK